MAIYRLHSGTVSLLRLQDQRFAAVYRTCALAAPLLPPPEGPPGLSLPPLGPRHKALIHPEAQSHLWSGWESVPASPGSLITAVTSRPPAPSTDSPPPPPNSPNFAQDVPTRAGAGFAAEVPCQGGASARGPHICTRALRAPTRACAHTPPSATPLPGSLASPRK